MGNKSKRQYMKAIRTAELAKQCFDGDFDPAEFCDLYFIGAWLDNDLIAVKIGVSKDCEQRLEELQRHTFAELSVLKYHTYATFELARHLEERAHKELQPYKIRGEWFYPSEAVLNYHPVLEATP